MAGPFHLIMSPKAAADLQAIHAVISKDSADNAAKMVGRILDAITALEILPHRNIVKHQSKKV